MNEKRPVNLHFFIKEHFDKFSKVCSNNSVNMGQVRRDNGEWYVTTEPLTSTERRKLIAAWASASMERITE